MKNLSILIFILFIVIFTSCNFIKKTKKAEGDMVESSHQSNYVINTQLSVADYSEYEGYFPKEGFIPTEEIAFQVAEIILGNIYGKEWIESEKPFSINLENDIWIIEGTLYSRKGGVAYMEIRKSSGEILKIYHGK